MQKYLTVTAFPITKLPMATYFSNPLPITSFDQEASLFAALTPRTTIITVNQRLCLTLQQHYTTWQRQTGQNCWVKPDILPLNAWLEREWLTLVTQNSRELRYLLKPIQKRFSWRAIWREQAANEYGLLLRDSMLNELIQAWDICAAWCCPIASVPDDTPETHFFITLATAYERYCEEQHYLDPACLPAALSQAIKNETFMPGKNLYLMGFDNTTPALNHLFNQWQQSRMQVNSCQISRVTSTQLQRLSFPDHVSEIRAAAAWALDCIQTDPDASVAFIMPDLENNRARIERIFTEIFNPEALILPEKSHALRFNISLGIPLADYPLIASAIQLWQLQLTQNPLERVSHLLLSPFLGGAENDYFARAQLDSTLRENGNKTLALKTLQRLATRSTARDQNIEDDHFAAGIKKLQYLLQNAASTKHANMGMWLQHFQQILAAMGWPGQRTLNSPEQQQLTRFQEILSECQQIDLFTATLTRFDALNILLERLNCQIFQPETPPTRVQILGILESAGLNFSHIWMTHLDSETWPTSAHANAYLPHWWQRANDMPHASPQHEQIFARTILQNLQQQCQTFWASYHSQDQDRELQISPMIAAFPENTTLPTRQSILIEQWYAARQVEEYRDIPPPPVLPEEIDNLATVGVALFKEQAACPFRAFAHLRLDAYALATPHTGLDARERGTLIHTILEQVWLILGDHATLTNMNDNTLRQLLKEQVTKELNTFNQLQQKNLARYFLDLEKIRLTEQLFRWLREQEQTRAPFSVIACEQRQTLNFDKLNLHIKIDRIDQLANGSRLIIDYKTGSSKRSALNWLEPKPQEPQLPLYALTPIPDVEGILFAEIHSSQPQFRGVCFDPAIFAEHKNVISIEKLGKNQDLHSWQALIDHWQTTMSALAEEFLMGNAAVEPHSADACLHCDLHMLCRIHELNHA